MRSLTPGKRRGDSRHNATISFVCLRSLKLRGEGVSSRPAPGVDEAELRMEATPGCAGSMRLVRRPSRKGRLEMCTLGAGGERQRRVGRRGGRCRLGWRRREDGRSWFRGRGGRGRRGRADAGAAARVPGQALSPGHWRSRMTDATLRAANNRRWQSCREATERCSAARSAGRRRCWWAASVPDGEVEVKGVEFT